MIMHLQKTLSPISIIGCCLALIFSGSLVSAQVKTLPKKKKTSVSTTATPTAPDQNIADATDSTPTTTQPQPVLQFNTSGNPANTADQGTLKFKAIHDDKSSSDRMMSDPVQNQENDAIFKTYIGYPKHQLTASYAPVSYGAKFAYKGYDFNYSSMDLMGLNLKYSFITTPSVFFDVDANYFSVKSKSGNAGSYIVSESTASVLQLMFRGSFCSISETSYFAKLCPGVELGLDSYPLLGFNSQGRIEMQTANEITYGVNFMAQAPLIKTTTIASRVGYRMGSGSGQSGNLTSKRNTVMYIDSKIEWPTSQKSLMNVGLFYGMRSSTVEGKTDTVTTDKWDNAIGQLSLRAGYTWEFGAD